ncbi:hypothetical protein RB195_014023 [Necator americanus]|uniref:Uncharacterized protein n=1 Tax=Necator americanus TaxID=51031 RepID=A0ABR1DYS3_NECAM
MDNIDDEYEWPVEYLRDCARKAKFQNHEETRDFGNSRADTIEEVLDEGQPCEQAGFRKGFSTIDQIHTISKLIELLHNPNFAIPREYRNLEWDDTGVKVTPSINQAEQMLTEFGETCGCFGLQLNLQKAMFMRKSVITAENVIFGRGHMQLIKFGENEEDESTAQQGSKTSNKENDFSLRKVSSRERKAIRKGYEMLPGARYAVATRKITDAVITHLSKFASCHKDYRLLMVESRRRNRTQYQNSFSPPIQLAERGSRFEKLHLLRPKEEELKVVASGSFETVERSHSFTS